MTSVKVIVFKLFVINCILLFSMLKNRLIMALRRRRNVRDEFRSQLGYSWDYVMVFKVYHETDTMSDKQCQFNMRYCLQKLAAGGMEIRLFYSLRVIL
jgi:hypothetical protein